MSLRGRPRQSLLSTRKLIKKTAEIFNNGAGRGSPGYVSSGGQRAIVREIFGAIVFLAVEAEAEAVMARQQTRKL